MKSIRLKVARIGNSRGVRLPAATLARYRISDAVVMEERADGILLRPQGSADTKLSFADTADAMAGAREDWSDWDSANSDGLDAIPWDNHRPRRVAEATDAPYTANPRPRKKRA
jgi:antitoxin component of MazEF toxin-antitoxin module